MTSNGVMENIEEVLMELNSFERRVTKEEFADIPKILDDYLAFVARTGNTHFPWAKIKPLFKSKLERVICEFSRNSDEIPPTPNVDLFQFEIVKNKVFEQLEFFAGIPFTVQRLCELLTAPSKHYKRTDKFMRALEKNILVVSTVEAGHPSPPLPTTNGVKDSFSTTLEQREREEEQQRHLVNGSSSASCEDEALSQECKEEKSESFTAQSQPKRLNGTALDIETSGPCDSGESSSSSSSSSESSSPNSRSLVDDAGTSDSTTNNEASSSFKSDKPPAEEDAMEIDTECSSSDNRLVVERRDEDDDRVHSSEERPRKKFKPSLEKVEETSPSSSKDDVLQNTDNSTLACHEPTHTDDTSTVSTSEDLSKNEPVVKDPSISDEATPITSTENQFNSVADCTPELKDVEPKEKESSSSENERQESYSSSSTEQSSVN